MNKPFDIYCKCTRRIACLLAWLDCELERHEAGAEKPENAAAIWPKIGDLTHVEELLKAPLCFLSGFTEEDLDRALDDYDEEGGCDE